MNFIKSIMLKVALDEEGDFDYGEVEIILKAGEYPHNTLGRVLSADTFASISAFVSKNCDLHSHEEDEDNTGFYSTTVWTFPDLELTPEQKEYMVKINEFMSWLHENKKDIARTFKNPYAYGYLHAHMTTMQYQIDMVFEWMNLYYRVANERGEVKNADS